MNWLERYDVGVPAQVEVPSGPLSSLIRESAVRYPRRCAVWTEQGALTYEQLLGEVQKFASLLAGLGVGRGDRVLVMLPNSLQQVVAIYGALWRGAVAVPVCLESPPATLKAQLVDSQPRVALVAHPLPPTLEEAVRKQGPEQLIFCSGREYARNLAGWLAQAVGLASGPMPTRRVLRWRDLMAQAREGLPMESVESQAPALISYTAGTTGLPRGVVLGHRALLANTLQLASWEERAQAGREIILLALPVAHCYGFCSGLSLSLRLAGTLILTDPSDTTQLLELCTRFRPTLFPGIPSIYAALLNRPDLRSYKLSSIRACLSGAAPLPVEVQEGFEKVTKGRLVEGYGLTEAAPATHCNPLYGERRSGSIGVPLPSTEARVVDPETGQDMPDGKVGELLVRGPQLMDGYWGNPQATEKALRQGWLHTQDLAQRDRDGYFYLVNRRQDVVEIGGKRIYPRDVEEVLYEHPCVQEVAVIGWPPGRFEGIQAFLVVRPGQRVGLDELEAFCRRRLPAHLVPSGWTLVNSLPRSPFGKLLRGELAPLVEEA